MDIHHDVLKMSLDPPSLTCLIREDSAGHSAPLRKTGLKHSVQYGPENVYVVHQTDGYHSHPKFLDETSLVYHGLKLSVDRTRPGPFGQNPKTADTMRQNEENPARKPTERHTQRAKQAETRKTGNPNERDDLRQKHNPQDEPNNSEETNCTKTDERPWARLVEGELRCR